MAKKPNLTLEIIAERIHKHLLLMEDSVNWLWHPACFEAGRYVGIKYKRFWNADYISKAEALEYLAWLEAGNAGLHYEALKTGGKK